jgi:hypothetical protein
VINNIMRDYFITTIRGIFVDVNQEYLDRYLSLVLDYIPVYDYIERHHILPKSLFPQYKKDKWNIVSLSAKDHFLAHYYLHKALPNEPNMTFGLWGMCNQKSPNHTDRTYIDDNVDEFAAIYEEARIAHAALFQERQLLNNTMKGRTKENSPFFGKKRSKDIVDKMTANHWSKWRKPWNHNMADKSVWMDSITLYNTWMQSEKCGRKALETQLGRRKDSLNTIHSHFVKGWNPLTDQSFIDWLALHT